jgi:hypothetical protein
MRAGRQEDTERDREETDLCTRLRRIGQAKIMSTRAGKAGIKDKAGVAPRGHRRSRLSPSESDERGATRDGRAEDGGTVSQQTLLDDGQADALTLAEYGSWLQERSR